MKPILEKLARGISLAAAEMAEAMELIVTGRADDGQIEEFLRALAKKGESASEIAAAARVMRHHALKLSKPYPDLLDTCGTGGDAKHTLNISTLSAIFVSAGGVQVGKHGNRSVSSQCGSADLLEMLGVKIDLPVTAIERSIETIGFGFFFAPLFHPATRYAMPARRQIREKTIFNVLGPLSNPGGALHQLIGVYSDKLVPVVARVLRELGAKRALVVHGKDGLDEITTCDDTLVSELDHGKIRDYVLSPEEFGLKRADPADLRCESKERCKEAALDIIAGRRGPQSDVVLLNAAAAFYVSGKVRSIAEGLEVAGEILESGSPREKLEEIQSFTQAHSV
jgi:anthranilate phosphoribosyltransferase